MCLFENLTIEVQNWRCEKATQYQQPCWSGGRRLFAFGFHTAAETVEDSSRAEELESFLGVIHSQEACSLNFVSTCDYGFSWKSSTTSIRSCSIAVFVNHVSDTSPRLIPFQSDQRPPSCIGLLACLPFFCLPSVPSLVWILSIRDLNSSQLLDVEPLGRTVTHILTFSCRVFSQCVIRATQHGWDWDSRWLLSTCCCASPPSCLVTMDFPRWTQHASTICSLSLCNKSQNQWSQAFFFLTPCVQDYFKSLLVSISDCIWMDQTLCLGGGSWDCSPAG